MKRDIEAFKNELKNFKYYIAEINNLKKEIDLLEYEARNVKGIDYSKQSSHNCNEHAIAMKRLQQVEEMEELLQEKNECEMMVRRIARRLNKLNDDDRKLLIDVIANKKKYRAVCKELNLNNTSSLFNKINDIIQNVLPRRKM